MKVQLRHPHSGKLKTIKVGWSWPLFFSPGGLGLPLFFRGLPIWGFVLLTLSIFDLSEPLFAGDHDYAVSSVMDLVLLGVAIWLGINGNRMIGRSLLAQGWRMTDPHSEAARSAVRNWGVTAHEVGFAALL